MNTPTEKDYIDAKLQAVIERLDQGHDWIRVRSGNWTQAEPLKDD